MLHVVPCPRCPLGYRQDGHVVPEHRPLHQVIVGQPGSIPDVITLPAGPLCKGSNAFVCPRCGKPSWHPGDAEHGYCGQCHWWTGDPTLGAPEILAELDLARAG